MVALLSCGRRNRSRQWFLARLTTARRAYGVGSPRNRRHFRATCSSAVCTTSSAWPRSPVSRYAVRSNSGDASRTNWSKSPPDTSIRTPVNTPPRSKGLHGSADRPHAGAPGERALISLLSRTLPAAAESLARCAHTWAPAAAFVLIGGSAAVDGEGLAHDGGAEPADRPGAGGGGGSGGGQEADITWAGRWHLLPGGAADDGEAHRPGVAGGGGGHAGQVVTQARAGAGHACPFGAVPVQDQGLVTGDGAKLTNRPGVAGGGGGHVGQVVERTGVGAGYLSPFGAVPVQDQGPVATGGAGVVTDRPGIAGGGGPHRGQ